MNAQSFAKHLANQLPMSQAQFARFIHNTIESFAQMRLECPYTYDGASTIHFPLEGISVIVDPKTPKVILRGTKS